MIPVVFPSSLITKFLNTGLFKISLNPFFLFIPSLFNVLKFFNFSVNVSSVLVSKGTSNIVITLSIQSRLCILYFRLNKLLIEFSEIIDSFGVKVKTKNSFELYLLLISFKYCRSGSPSISNVSEEASNLKSLEK